MQIKVIGYYNHYNLGDDQYKLTFKYFFEKYFANESNFLSVEYIDCDTLKHHSFSDNDNDLIILGGGDILNEYFLDQIISKFYNKPNKIIAISVGLPYIDILINTYKLHIIDTIFIRTKQDLEIFKQYSIKNVFYLPDLSLFIKHLIVNGDNVNVDNVNVDSNGFIYKLLENVDKKIVAIILSRHIYSNDNNLNYNKIIKNLSHFIKYLINSNFHIVFLPFNTNTNNTWIWDSSKNDFSLNKNIQLSLNNNENDILIHNDVYNYILKTHPELTNNITNIQERLSVTQTFELYKLFYITIPMRFHACLFSIYANVPMIPIFTTRKIKNLLLDINWNFGYELNLNTDDKPIDISCNVLIRRFLSVQNLYCKLINKLNIINNNFNLEFNNENFIKGINILNPNKLIKDKNQDKDCLAIPSDIIIDNLLNKLNTAFLTLNINVQVSLNSFNLSTITDNTHQDLITQLISYNLVNSTNSIYTYGLKEKLFKANFNPKEEFKWIIKDNSLKNLNKPLVSSKNGLFNLHFIDQHDYSGSHRAGWQYVFEHLKLYHNERSNLLLDLYLDRTFHWNKDINKLLNIIPYTTPWIGFVHHTFDTSFSFYNNKIMLENPDFLESLKCCKGIFVLSTYLQEQFINEFKKYNIIVSVYSLIHPTETIVEKFNYKKFILNTDKKIIHVGGWLRNIYSFYQLTLPNIIKLKTSCIKSNSFPLKKVILKGVNMNNYFPTSKFIDNLGNFLYNEQQFNCNPSNASNNVSNNASNNASNNVSNNASNNASNNVSNNASNNDSNNVSNNASSNVSSTFGIRNNWYLHYIQDVENICNSVSFIDTLNNDDFDLLLTNNIVFINLVDASAVNTVIECIIRNTPIIINKHPAVVELLGENYPLYYTFDETNYFQMNVDINNLLKNPRNIKKAYNYLNNLNEIKYRLTIDSFIKEFTDIIKTHIYIK
jgi:polysaccharide pyruvyl transferase WcaK-like protein